MKLSLLIITRKQRNWKKFLPLEMTAFPELYFSFPAVLGAIYHHTARERKGWFVLCRLPVLPGGSNSYTACSFLRESFPLLAFLLWWCVFSTSQHTFLELLVAWSLHKATSSTGSAQILSRAGEGSGVFQSWDSWQRGRNVSSFQQKFTVADQGFSG